MFRGPLTYASTPFEVVDWSLFDVIGVDHYRNSKVGDHRYAETIRRYLGQGKPVVNSEFGHSRYRGTATVTWSSARWTRYRWRCTGYRSRAGSCAPG